MCLFNGVSSAPQSRHKASETGAECFPAWLPKHLPQPRRTGSVAASARFWVPSSLRAGEAESRSRDLPSLQSCSLPPVLLLCMSSERGGRRCAVCAGGMLLGKEAEGMAQWGSTWAFLSDVSDVHAVVVSWVCN